MRAVTTILLLSSLALTGPVEAGKLSGQVGTLPNAVKGTPSQRHFPPPPPWPSYCKPRWHAVHGIDGDTVAPQPRCEEL